MITIIKCLDCGVWWRWEDAFIPCKCEKGVWIIDSERESEWGV